MKQKSSILQIFSMIKNRIPALFIMVAANCAVASLSVSFALGSRNVIDTAVSGDKDSFTDACLIQGGIILAILVFFGLFRFLKERLIGQVDRDLKRDFMKSVVSADFSKASAYHSGELINRASNDIRILTDGIFNVIPGFVSMVLKMAISFFALWKLEKGFALVILAAGFAVVALTGIMRISLKGLHKKISSADGVVTSFFQEIFEKLIVVQAMGAEREVIGRADALLGQRFSLQMKRKNINILANLGVSSMSYLASFAALAWCSVGIINGSTTFGGLTAVTQLVLQLQSPVTNLSGTIPQYVAMIAAWERLKEIFDIREDKRESFADIRGLYEKTQTVGCRSLSFTYDRDTVFDKADFEIEKGSFILIKGSSGIGKSTLLKLMLGIYKADECEFYLRNSEGETILNKEHRGIFSYVPQGNLLLSGTIRDNLLLGNPDSDEEMINQAVYVSCMDEYLSSLPDGLDTVLTENSGGLSEGQAQRIAIARALLSGAPIMLFDEITSALDSRTESMVLERIKTLKNRTCFIVTHRPVSEELCDGVLEIEKGRINLIKYEI